MHRSLNNNEKSKIGNIEKEKTSKNMPTKKDLIRNWISKRIT